MGRRVLFRRLRQGTPRQVGAEANWEPRNFSVKSESSRTRDDREGQGILADDLPALIRQAGTVGATWVVTGEDKSGGVEPRRPLFAGGIGAIELAGRYERIRMGSDFPGEPEEQNPRAVNLLENGERLWTVGLNWYLNRWMRIQLNGIRETIDDIERSPLPPRTRSGSEWRGCSWFSSSQLPSWRTLCFGVARRPGSHSYW